jgi:hypothetical protein
MVGRYTGVDGKYRSENIGTNTPTSSQREPQSVRRAEPERRIKFVYVRNLLVPRPNLGRTKSRACQCFADVFVQCIEYARVQDEGIQFNECKKFESNNIAKEYKCQVTTLDLAASAAQACRQALQASDVLLASLRQACPPREVASRHP